MHEVQATRYEMRGKMTVIGIDLGTTYSVVAYIKDGVPTIIPNAEGEALTPSIVGFDNSGHVFVGKLAESRSILDSEGTVRSIKRKMGSDFTALIHGRSYTPTVISSFILGKLKRDAECYLGEKVSEAVVTVPAYFSDNAREATKNAAEIAGLKVLRIINEPTAATLAYGISQKDGEQVMVWDLGGGTFDVSILEFSGGVYEVKSTSGDMKLGGDDWRDILSQHFLDLLCNQYKSEFVETLDILNRILLVSEKAKKDLTNKEEANISLSFPGSEGRWHVGRIGVTRQEFELLSLRLCDRLIPPARQALKDAKVKTSDLDKVILVGGATRMPMVRHRVAEFAGREPYVDIDPDKVVAVGAAIQAGILTGALKKAVLVDIIPLSLGIETQGGIFTKLIERNTKVPISKDRIFTTAMDNQPEVEIHVLQGERALAEHNTSLGNFTLTEIPEAPKGIPKISVIFSVDINGILNVHAEDVYTGNEREMIVRSDRLQQDDINKLIKEAENYKESDALLKETIVARVELERIVEAAKQSIDEMKIQSSDVFYKEAFSLIEKAESMLSDGDLMGLKEMSQNIKDTMDLIYDRWKKKNTEDRPAVAG